MYVKVTSNLVYPCTNTGFLQPKKHIMDEKESIFNLRINCNDKCILRPYVESDCVQLKTVADNKEVAHYLRSVFPHPYSIDDAKDWIQFNNSNYKNYDKLATQIKLEHKDKKNEKQNENDTKTDIIVTNNSIDMKIESFHLAITQYSKDNKNNIVIGGIGITRNPMEYHICEIGYWLNPEYWRKKIVSNAVKEMIQFIWDETNVVLNGIVRIEANVSIENIGSQGVLIKNEFEKEGICRKSHCFRDGTIGDCIMFAKIRKDHQN